MQKREEEKHQNTTTPKLQEWKEPPRQLKRNLLTYSKFTPSAALKLNPYPNATDHIRSPTTQIESTAISTLSQEEWSKNMEQRFEKRMREIEAQFEH